ncbi:hypothetical protein ACTGJ9_029055 [Bradyrhizobium sp. RDM12]
MLPDLVSLIPRYEGALPWALHCFAIILFGMRDQRVTSGQVDHILRSVLMALLEQPEATMHDILRMLSDKDYRKQIGRAVQNQPVRRFFEQEYEKFSSSYRTDASAPIQNKVGAFLADTALARMLSAPKREIRIRQVMDEGKVLIANLAKGRIGEDSSSLLGGLWLPRWDLPHILA